MGPHLPPGPSFSRHSTRKQDPIPESPPALSVTSCASLYSPPVLKRDPDPNPDNPKRTLFYRASAAPASRAPMFSASVFPEKRFRITSARLSVFTIPLFWAMHPRAMMFAIPT